MVQIKKDAFKENSKGVNLLVFDYGNKTSKGMHGLDVQIDSRQPGFKDGSVLAPSKSGSLRLVDRENYVNGQDVLNTHCFTLKVNWNSLQTLLETKKLQLL